jgi:hypothetical protein
MMITESTGSAMHKSFQLSIGRSERQPLATGHLGWGAPKLFEQYSSRPGNAREHRS